MAHRGYLAGEVAEDFAHRLVTRREAIRRLCLLGLSLPSAVALLAACADDGDGDGARWAPWASASAGP
ncbi:MAG: hypothetical protein M3P85_04295 [Actinomycetota bacterium]|nr:hypothetical protein [Actinomycetota bacterium]